MLGSAVLVAGALIAGFIGQRYRDSRIRATHPAPGSFVTVDGHAVHYRERGAGDFTFVLEAGLGDYSGSWGELEPALAEIDRVFVYDRAGLGWSEEGPHPRTARQIVRELHRALEEAHVRKPYILVGHSLGGLTQTLYAMTYPRDVAGLLLIDPSHKDQFERMPRPPALFTLLLPQFTRTAAFGLPQLLFKSRDPMQNLARHVATSGAELRAVLDAARNWGAGLINLGNMPIYVLTAGDYQKWPANSEAEQRAAWEVVKSLHAELVAASTSEIRKQEVVPGATHYVHRAQLAAVVAAARELVDRIKARTPQSGARN